MNESMIVEFNVLFNKMKINFIEWNLTSEVRNSDFANNIYFSAGCSRLYTYYGVCVNC